jgi:hypothetical protein
MPTPPTNPALWKPGQSGNPAGRKPNVKTISDLLRWSGELEAPEQLVEKMRKVFGIAPDVRLTVDQATILRCRIEALQGDARHLQFWAERTEGKIRETLKLEGGQSLTIVEEIVDGGTIDRRKLAGGQGDTIREEPAKE